MSPFRLEIGRLLELRTGGDNLSYMVLGREPVLKRVFPTKSSLLRDVVGGLCNHTMPVCFRGQVE